MPGSLSQPSSPLAFFADAMLGKLSRWLRILGYDTAYEKVIADQALIERVFTDHLLSMLASSP